MNLLPPAFMMTLSAPEPESPNILFIIADDLKTSLVFRIECAHATPDGAANTKLQFAEINLYGIVK